jgi:hypothetical protein
MKLANTKYALNTMTPAQKEILSMWMQKQACTRVDSKGKVYAVTDIVIEAKALYSGDYFAYIDVKNVVSWGYAPSRFNASKFVDRSDACN